MTLLSSLRRALTRVRSVFRVSLYYVLVSYLSYCILWPYYTDTMSLGKLFTLNSMGARRHVQGEEYLPPENVEKCFFVANV